MIGNLRDVREVRRCRTPVAGTASGSCPDDGTVHQLFVSPRSQFFRLIRDASRLASPFVALAARWSGAARTLRATLGRLSPPRQRERRLLQRVIGAIDARMPGVRVAIEELSSRLPSIAEPRRSRFASGFGSGTARSGTPGSATIRPLPATMSNSGCSCVQPDRALPIRRAPWPPRRPPPSRWSRRSRATRASRCWFPIP